MALQRGGFTRLPAPSRRGATRKHSPSHLALLVTTFKVGSAELAFAKGHRKEAHWLGPLLTSLWGQQRPGRFQPMCYISGPVKRRMERTGHGHRGTNRDAVVPAPETLYAA